MTVTSMQVCGHVSNLTDIILHCCKKLFKMPLLHWQVTVWPADTTCVQNMQTRCAVIGWISPELLPFKHISIAYWRSQLGGLQSRFIFWRPHIKILRWKPGLLPEVFLSFLSFFMKISGSYIALIMQQLHPALLTLSYSELLMWLHHNRATHLLL
jgi:hypothetical protein